MSKQYDDYIVSHKCNVLKAYVWLKEYLPELFDIIKDMGINLDQQLAIHDESKYTWEEYDAYDKYFYGGNKSYSVVNDFNYAWLHHIHNNQHHWQHWVLTNDDPLEGTIIMDIPDNFIIEMICDWWAFSWKTGDLHSMFSWYSDHTEYMQLSDSTRVKVENILEKIKNQLEVNENGND